MGVVAGIISRFGPQSFTYIYEHWVGLVTASVLMAIFQALYCYISPYLGNKLLALGGNTGNPIYDVRRPHVSYPLRRPHSFRRF